MKIENLEQAVAVLEGVLAHMSNETVENALSYIKTRTIDTSLLMDGVEGHSHLLYQINNGLEN